MLELDYFTKIMLIYNQMKKYKEKMEETHVVEKILHSRTHGKITSP
jgi:hypothetical protein